MKKHNGSKEATETILLVQAAARGDKSAVEKLFKRYNSGLYSFCFSILKNSEDAHDATQETWLGVINGGFRFDGRIAKFSTWIYGIAKNVSIDVLRKHEVRNEISLDQVIAQDTDGNEMALKEVLANFTPSPEKIIEDDEQRYAVNTILEQLGIRGEMLRLYYVEGLNIEEIAKIFETTKGTVSVRMSEGRYKFRQIVSKIPELRDIFDQ